MPNYSHEYHSSLFTEWIESPSNHTILKDEDVSSVREGEWKRLNTLGHYEVPDGTCLRLVRRFASGIDTSGESSQLCYSSFSGYLHDSALPGQNERWVN